MTIRTLSLAALAATFAAGTALAQQRWVEVDDQVQVAPFGQVADTVEDWDVHSADGTKIGDVEDVIGTDAQTPTALVVDFDDDAGYGDRDDVVIEIGQFTWANDRLVLDADAAAVAAMPVWDD